jgi:inosine-uridine nucleoside N-ribohydrolase
MLTKIIIDADPGIGGALALCFALSQPELEVVGVCTSYGHVDGPTALRNTIYLCALAGRRVAVAEGVNAPLKKAPMRPDPDLEGADGLGNLPDLQRMSYPPEPLSAARFIADRAGAFPGEITLLTLGPLTNLCLAHRQEPLLHERLKRVVIGGGSVAQAGNVSPVAESNIWHDPHAADHVFTNLFNITLLGLDVTESMILTMDQMRSIKPMRASPLYDLLLHAAQFSAKYYAALNTELALNEGFIAHELMPLVYLLRPEWFRLAHGRVRVAVDGVAEGMTIMDRRPDFKFPQPGWEPHMPLVQAALSVQAQLCQQLVLKSLHTFFDI